MKLEFRGTVTLREPMSQQCLTVCYVGRAAPPIEENWDSDKEKEQRMVVAAGVMGEEEPAE